jgi:DNA-binding response OmpR family regulator
MNTRVLIVEDHPDIRALLCVALEQDYEVLQARDGAEALDVAYREQPDVMLLDIMLPGALSGLDVLRAVKAHETTRSMAVAMVTARTRQADILQCQSDGADAYFCKPFSPVELLNWLQARRPSPGQIDLNPPH